MVKATCGDCKGNAYIGGAEIYQCVFNSEAWSKIDPENRQKVVEERIEIECDKFDLAPRELRIKMREYTEVGITTVYGGGSVQLPADIRQDLELKDGDKILWIRKGRREYTFRKVGYKPPFKPHYL